MKKWKLKKWVVGCLVTIMFINFILMASLNENLMLWQVILAVAGLLTINGFILWVLYNFSTVFYE
jgi:hypothetical protein